MADDLLLERIDELQEDLGLVETMLHRAASRRDSLTTLSRLVRIGGDGTLGEPLRRIRTQLMALQDRFGDDARAELDDLAAHVGTLQDRLRQAARSATEIGDRLRLLDLDGRNEVNRDIQDSLQYCNTLTDQLDALREEMAGGVGGAAAWEAFDKIADRCQPLFADYVDFLAGVTLRDYELDDGVASLADRVFKELNAGAVAVPSRRGDAESRLRTVARFHFPEWTIWDVPLAGYHAGLSRAARLAPTLRERFAHAYGESFVDQLFAEVYAARLVGPAYACSALLLHLHPRDTTRTQDHPSATDRAYVVLATLRSYQDTDGFELMTGRLAAWWADASGGVAPPDAAQLDDFVARTLAGPLRDGHWSRAYDPARWTEVTASVRTAADVRSGDNISVLDQVNAAWHLRLTSRDEARSVHATSGRTAAGGRPTARPHRDGGNARSQNGWGQP